MRRRMRVVEVTPLALRLGWSLLFLVCLYFLVGGGEGAGLVARSGDKRPKRESPLVFYHQRKAGGSTLRYALYHSFILNSHGTARETWMPCHTPGVDCDRYFPNADTELRDVVLVGGHIPFGALDDHVNRYRSKARERPYNDTQTMSYTCLTNIRHPIDRIESCVMYRFKETGRELLRETDYDRVATFLTTHLDSKGATCLAEPMRIMSSSLSEVDINRVATQPHDKKSVYLTLMTVENLQKCWISVLERQVESRALLRKVLPWISPISLRKKFKNSKHSKQNIHWPNHLRARLEETLALREMEVYRNASAIFDQQLKRLGVDPTDRPDLDDIDEHLGRQSEGDNEEWAVNKRGRAATLERAAATFHKDPAAHAGEGWTLHTVRREDSRSFRHTLERPDRVRGALAAAQSSPRASSADSRGAGDNGRDLGVAGRPKRPSLPSLPSQALMVKKQTQARALETASLSAAKHALQESREYREAAAKRRSERAQQTLDRMNKLGRSGSRSFRV